MGILKGIRRFFKGIKRFFLIRENVFEISSDSGLVSSYAIRKARGEGGKSDPKLAEILARNAEKLEQKRQKAKELKSKGETPKETKGKVVRMRAVK